MNQPGDTQTLDLSGGSASDTSAALDSAADSIAAEILPRSETDESQETGADPALVSPPAADPESKTAKTSDSESFSPEQKQEQQQEIPEPPSSLTKEEKEIWNKLPQEARDIIQRREENFHKGFNELKPVADLGMGFGRHLLLDRPFPVSCPVRILQGEADPDVPWQQCKRQRNADGSESSVWEKWLAFSPDPQYLSLYARYDPGMMVRRHGHYSPHVVFVVAFLVFVVEQSLFGALNTYP